MHTIRCFLLLFICVNVVSTHYAHSETLRIAVASNFQPVAKQLINNFQVKHPEHRITLSTASSGKLYAQIYHGAPFDIFLSADMLRPQKLVTQGLALADSLSIYATGQLAIIIKGEDSSASIPEHINTQTKLDAFASILKESSAHIAIANPDLAPYGAATVEMLNAMGVYEDVKTRFVMGENVAQTFHFSRKGGVNISIVSYAQVLNEQQKPEKPKETYIRVPSNLHTPIHQGAVLLKKSNNKALAKTFLNYLKQKEATTIIQKGGYLRENTEKINTKE